MSLYKEISTLVPYLQSIRKLEEYISFDLSFPITWKLPKKYVNEEMSVIHPQQNNEVKLISFFSTLSDEDFDKNISNIKAIIKYNHDREEKERLFQHKVEELKQIFEKNNLSSLKNLSFDIKNKIPQLNENEEVFTGLAAEGDSQGQ
jgi:hypothetical protein